MNITELAERVATGQNLDKGQARKVIEATLKAVVEAAKDGAEIRINGFSSFKAQERPEHEGRNPATGEAMTLAPTRKLANGAGRSAAVSGRRAASSECGARANPMPRIAPVAVP